MACHLAGQTFQACPRSCCQVVPYGKPWLDHVEKCDGSPRPETRNCAEVEKYQGVVVNRWAVNDCGMD